MPAFRRFPPPWPVEVTAACFITRDRGGQALAYVYFEEEPGRRAAAKLNTGEAPLGEGQKPESTRRHTRGGGGLGAAVVDPISSLPDAVLVPVFSISKCRALFQELWRAR